MGRGDLRVIEEIENGYLQESKKCLECDNLIYWHYKPGDRDKWGVSDLCWSHDPKEQERQRRLGAMVKRG